MSNIEEDFKLFQLVKRKPIKNCIDLTKGLRGKTSGIFYFTEDFRIDFENKMCDLERLKTEREQDKARIKELEEALLKVKDKNTTLFITCRNSIPKQKVKNRIKENKKLIDETYSEDIIQKLTDENEILEELLEDK